MITYRKISPLPSSLVEKMLITFHYTRTGTVMCNCYPSNRYPPIETKSKTLMTDRIYDALRKAFPESRNFCDSEYDIYKWLEEKGYFVVAVINS